MTRATPPQKREVKEDPYRLYEVLSERCVFGKVGEVVSLKLTDGEELTMTQAGTLRRAYQRPAVADYKEGEAP